MAAFSAEDASNIKKLGDIGTLDGGAAEYVLIWRIVSEAHIPLSDIEKEWTFDRIMSFHDYMSMKQDYKSAWTELFGMEEKEKQQKPR